MSQVEPERGLGQVKTLQLPHSHTILGHLEFVLAVIAMQLLSVQQQVQPNDCMVAIL